MIACRRELESLLSYAIIHWESPTQHALSATCHLPLNFHLYSLQLFHSLVLDFQNVIKTTTGVRTLWCEIPEVRDKGTLASMTMEERKFQEVRGFFWKTD